METRKYKCRDYIKQCQAIKESNPNGIQLLHQPSEDQMEAATFVRQYLEAVNKRYFNSFFSQYSDKMLAQVGPVSSPSPPPC